MKRFETSIDDKNRVFITMRISRHDNTKVSWIEFKYDPGADITTISLDDLFKLDYTFDDIKSNSYKYGEATTAGGETYEMFAMDLRVNSIMRQVIPKDLKLTFASLTKKYVPPPNKDCSGCKLTGEIYGGWRSSLLGNDVLSAFDSVTDRDKKAMFFTRLSDLAEHNRKYPHCELLEISLGSDDADNTVR